VDDRERKRRRRKSAVGRGRRGNRRERVATVVAK
jgi:hypothetical protein